MEAETRRLATRHILAGADVYEFSFVVLRYQETVSIDHVAHLPNEWWTTRSDATTEP
jgi:hypothetical protein